MYRLENDSELINKLRQNDRIAYAEIYTRFSERMIRYAYKRISDWNVAEDIVQDIMLKLWLNRAKLAEIENLEGYLYAAVRFKTIDYLIRESKSPVKSAAQPAEMSGTSDASDELEFKTLLKRFNEELRSLPEKSRYIFVNAENETVEEIAAALGMTVAAVYKNMQRTIFRLKTALRLIILMLVSGRFF